MLDKRCRYFLILCFCICAFSLTAQIPGAIQQPKWSMAFYFLEAGGARDTLYLGYDPNADIQLAESDTIFGEKLSPVDTSAFSVRWDYNCFSPVCDSIFKVNVSSLWMNYFPLPSNGTMRFQNGKMPLQIIWDISLFHSDSLPFPDQDPLPRAQGNLYYQFSFCALRVNGNWLNSCQSTNDNLLISDTSLGDCWTKDSVSFAFYFGNPLDSSINGYLMLRIDPWTGYILGVENNMNDLSNVLVYPNPANDKIHIQMSNKFLYNSISLYNVVGKRLKTELVRADAETEMDVSDLCAGVYFLKINSLEKEIIRKIIITG